ncbi:MAG: HPr family phosphocarrier protein [Desulfococcus sp. 4484_241]|nr:MAG: HPr family phosphocarrier protein [Desulfococcus sp. 4484_241]
MNSASRKLVRKVRIVNDLGLHARAAAKMAEIASKAEGNIWLTTRNQDKSQKVDATSVIDILSVACSKGTDITLEAESDLDAGILDELVRLVETGFGE